MSTPVTTENEKLTTVQEGQNENDLQVGGGPDEQSATAEVAARLDFGCKYCDKKFPSKQALGGHQNAHRVERDKRRDSTSTTGGFMDYGFLHGHNATVQFSNFRSLPGGHFLGHLNWPWSSRPYFLPGQPVMAPEVPVRPSYAYPFLPTSPETAPLLQLPQPIHARFLPPAMSISGANTFPGLLANSPVTPSPSYILNSNPLNNQEIMDGELDLTLKL